MLERFLQNIKSKQLVADGSTTLVATSGGVDSVVLCHLFRLAGLPFTIAHCNFKLRDESSDLDEEFVRDLAERLQVEFFSIQFDTQGFAKQNKLSIQVAARELRYSWLETTRQIARCQQIATAHHLDDSIETMFYNFAKGCGLRGMHGIQEKNGHLVRPLLFATKTEVVNFAESQGIQFREDASNESDKYSRNLIRHHITPVFEKLNPQFQLTAGENLERIREAEALYDFAIGQIREVVFEQIEGGFKIDHLKLRSYPAPATVLFELLKPYHFNNAQVAQILQSLENQPGSWFESDAGRLLADRSHLIFSSGENFGGVLIIEDFPKGPTTLPDGRHLELNQWNGTVGMPSQHPNIAFLDESCLHFPLTIRHWQPGDWFCPLGMGGKRQKLQDFFSNNKLSRIEKEKVWLLESNGKIAWVVGWRLDERFKVTSTTNQIIQAVFL
jgi:tRNA(Ile)-lysidine synthase